MADELNPYAGVLDEEDKEAQGSNPYAEAVAEDIQSQRNSLVSTLEAAQTVKPDAVGEALRLSEQSGIDIGTVERNQDEVKRKVTANAYAGILDETPATREFLQDDTNAKLSTDAIPNLSEVEKKSNAFDRGRATSELGRLGAEFMRTRDPALLAQVEANKAKISLMQGDTEGFGEFLSAAGEVVGQVASSFEQTKTLAIAGTGAGIGFATAGPVGAAIGTGTGATAGIVADVFQVEAGFAFLEMVEEGIDQDVAAYLATVVGAANASLEMVSVLVVTKPLVEAGKRALKQGIRKAASSPRVMRLAADAAKYYGGAVATEAITEAVQEMVTIGATELAKEIDGNPDLESIDMTEAMERVVDSGKQAAMAMSLLAVPGAGVNVVNNRNRADRAEKNAKVMADIQSELSKSPLTERAPEKAADHAAAVLAPQFDTVYIPFEKLSAYAEGKGVDQATFFEQLGVSGQIEEAAAIGGDIRLSNRQFARAFLLDKEAFKTLEGDIRYGKADEMTANEAKEYKESGLKEEVDALGLGEEMDADTEATPTGKTVQGVSTAASQEVDVAEAELGLQGLFRTAAEAGMTQSEYAAYLAALQRSSEAGRRAQEAKHLNREKKRLNAEYQTARKQETAAAEAELSQTPVYAAIEYTSAGDRMSRADVEEILADWDIDNALPKNSAGKLVYTAKGEAGGVNPEVLASRYGFEDARSMLIAMIEAEDAKALVTSKVDAQMKERFGDLLDGIAANEAARESLHNDTTAEILAFELNKLREAKGDKETGKPSRVSPAVVRKAALEGLQNTQIKDIQPERYLANERRQARLAGQALRGTRKQTQAADKATGQKATFETTKSDRGAAAQAKFRQILSFFYAKESYKIRRRIEKQQRSVAKYLREGKKFKSIDASYVDQIKAVLAPISFDGPVNPEARAKWMQKQESNGAVFTKVNGVPVQKPFAEQTLAEWESTYAQVKNLEKQGRMVKKLTNAGKEQEKAAVVAELLAESASLKERPRAERQRTRQNPGWRDRSLSGLAYADAAVRKVEFLLKRLDGGKIGAWHRNIFQPIADAQTKQLDFSQEIINPLLKDLENMPAEVRKRMGQKVYIKGLGRTFRHSDLLVMLLNAGNTSNYKKMMEGSALDNGARPWTDAGVREAFTHLTAWEAKWVQKVWDSFQTTYPLIETIYRQENGISPERIVGRSITVDGVKLRGGYFPMMYDGRREVTTQDPKIVQTALGAMQTPIVQATVYSGMTKSRTDFAAPVLLELSRLPLAFQQMSHFITHYETVRNTQKLLRDKAVRTEIRNKLGPEYMEELDSWLEAVATSGMGGVETKFWDPMFQFFRTNLTAAVMGASYTTMISQTFGLTSSIAQLGMSEGGKFSGTTGARWLASGMATYASGLAGQNNSIKNAFRLSGELRHRLSNTDREISHAMDDLAKRQTRVGRLLAKQQRLSLMLIGGVQLYSVDLPTWIGAFNKAQAEGKADDVAVQYADSILRTSQSAGHIKDLSNLQRRKGPWRALTMFASYVMLLYNLEAETFSAMKQRKNVLGGLSRMMWLISIPALMDALMRGEMPDEDDDPAEWLALKNISYAMSSIPIFGRGVGSLLEGYRPSLSSLDSLGGSAQKFGHEVSRIVEGEDADLATAKASVQAFGSILGIGGTNQLVRILDAIEAGDDAEMYDFLIGYKDE